MTRFLISEEHPEGYRLEDILQLIRREVLIRCTKIADDARPEARVVLKNNMRILSLLTEAIGAAEDSTHVLDRAFGPSAATQGGPPRIGRL